MRNKAIVLLLLLVGSMNAHAYYESTHEQIQWDKRGNDTFYCIDITDDKFQIHPWLQAVACGENLYSFSPKEYLGQMRRSNSLGTGTRFGWRVWSASGYGGTGYEGIVTVQSCTGQAYGSSNTNIQWGCRNNDSFYCIDILNLQGDFIKQAATCNEGLHNFSPTSLNLGAGEYRWKVWSPAGYGGDGFEGQFSIASSTVVTPAASCTGQAYGSSSTNIQWGCRNNDNLYCIDILNLQGDFIKQAATCNEGLHNFSPTSLNLGAGEYRWKVWSATGYGGDGFEGQFSIASSTVVSPAANGKVLFNQYCAGCHRSPNNIREAASATSIRSAINGNKGGMKSLSSLTDTQLNDIAAYVQNPN